MNIGDSSERVARFGIYTHWPSYLFPLSEPEILFSTSKDRPMSIYACGIIIERCRWMLGQRSLHFQSPRPRVSDNSRAGRMTKEGRGRRLKIIEIISLSPSFLLSFSVSLFCGRIRMVKTWLHLRRFPRVINNRKHTRIVRVTLQRRIDLHLKRRFDKTSPGDRVGMIERHPKLACLYPTYTYKLALNAATNERIQSYQFRS